MTRYQRAMLKALECDKQDCSCHTVTEVGHGTTHCPTHNDKVPSLTVRVLNALMLWQCGAGCDVTHVQSALSQ